MHSFCPFPCFLVKAKLLHRRFRIKLLEADLQRGLRLSKDTETIAFFKTGIAEVPDALHSHGVQILLKGYRVDGDHPEQVRLTERAVYHNMVDLLTGVFVFIDDAGHDRVHLRIFKGFEADIRAADGHGLACHVHDLGVLGAVKAEEHVGHTGEDQHRNQNDGDQEADDELDKKRRGFLQYGDGRAFGSAERRGFCDPVKSSRFSRSVRGILQLVIPLLVRRLRLPSGQECLRESWESYRCHPPGCLPVRACPPLCLERLLSVGRFLRCRGAKWDSAGAADGLSAVP